LGHSYGGTTSLLVAPNAHPEWSDERVKAIMPIAPVAEGRLWYAESFLGKLLSKHTHYTRTSSSNIL